MGEHLRVAMVHGPGPADQDGVSDYVARLAGALVQVDVEAVPVRLRPARSPLPWVAAAARAGRDLRRLRPHLVHVQFAPSAYRFSAAPGLLPLLVRGCAPLVTTVHEYGSWAVPGWLPERLWRPVERAGWWDRETGRLVAASSRVIATNRGHAEQVRARTGVRPVEVPLAPNVEVHPLPPGARHRVRRRYGVDPDAPLLVFFGFVHPVKGLRYVIEALPALRASRPTLRLLVVGGFTSQALPEPEATAFRRELEALAAERGVADHVVFTGHLPAVEVSAVLQAADVAVLPFTTGVTVKSGALLAALTHGLPTAVTAPDEPDDQLRDGETVAVIPARRDTRAVASTVRRLLDDPVLRRR
ncbi:MAG: glycosyltransferase family 4 protein, partial [Dactylosporangium sp.]|nr:glycosyltransferase family 4 protein [Dactylosporangium sp.]